MRLVSALIPLLMSTHAAATDAQNPFDPSSYLEESEIANEQTSQKLTKASIYRIDGQRFQRFDNASGGVLFPSPGEMPEVRETLVICAAHLDLFTEVIPIRRDLPISPAVRELEPQIIAMINRCNEGKIRGPERQVEARDGAVVTIKAAEPDAKTPGAKPGVETKVEKNLQIKGD